MPLIFPATIHDIVHLMSQLYAAAMREHPPIVLVNPFSGLDLPRIEPRAVEFLEHDEAEALYAAVEQVAGPGMRTFTELGTQVACGSASSPGCTGTGLTSCAGRFRLLTW